ncbi:MAG: gamma carbonic anhydrase family protein [Spirochaetia bacterium]|nr:gamma carbonic anhydrase family protein [Spirochaetia bacterium]
MIYRYKDKVPQLAPDVFVAENATVIGDVKIGAGSGIWFHSIARGDVHSIEIGENSNVQDHSVLHVTSGKFALHIGNNCTLGHRVTVHGCTLKDFAFLGIGSTVLDGCVIEEFGFLAAGSLLAPGKVIPARMLAMGSPAKVIREITAEEETMMRTIVQRYKDLKDVYRDPESFRPL